MHSSQKSNIIHFIQRVIGRLICCTFATEAVTLVKNFRYILPNRNITKNVIKSIDVINQAINNFDEPLIDLIDSRESNIIDDVFDYDKIDKSAWSEDDSRKCR